MEKLYYILTDNDIEIKPIFDYKTSAKHINYLFKDLPIQKIDTVFKIITTKNDNIKFDNILSIIHNTDIDLDNFSKLFQEKYDNITKQLYYINTPSKCTIDNIKVIDITKRVSKTYTMKYIIACNKMNELLKSLNLKLTTSYKYKDPNYKLINFAVGLDAFISNFHLLQYECGDFFKKHTDRIQNNDDSEFIHTHTLLLFPQNTQKLKGGDLILYDENDNSEIISPSTFTDWTFVLFRRDIIHQVTQIISGTRYVFKAAIYSTETNPIWLNSHLED